MNEENHSEEKNKHTTYDDEQTFGSTGKDSTKLIDAVSGLRVGSLLRVWTEISRINYMSTQPLDVITSGESFKWNKWNLLTSAMFENTVDKISCISLFGKVDRQCLLFTLLVLRLGLR